VEQRLSAGLSEGQVAEFVQHDEVEAGEMIGTASLAAGAGLGLARILTSCLSLVLLPFGFAGIAGVLSQYPF
jgi:hypothetical protein